MRFFTAVAASLALLAAQTFGAPASPLRTVEKYDGATKPNSYIVLLKNDVVKADHHAWFSQHLDQNSVITHDWEPEFLNGYAGTLSPDALKILRSSPDVDYIAEDGVFSINAAVTQTNAPWGLARISQNAELADQNTNDLTFTYTYDSSAGSGVDIYVVDTGIFTGHSEFGGRAIWGATFGGYADADGNGHGTHVSGTAAGSTYGVAKSAHLIAVKVLSDSGSGFVSDIVSGLSWVATQVQASGRPSIATMSLGGGASTPLDNAVASLTSAGIHVTVAAGNSDTDAGSTSPARAPSANTIGATTIADARASFSNYGSVVDLWAPGQNVISAWIGSTTATNNISGTSMATPHVAGLIATIISRGGNASPTSISATLQSLSIKNAISGVPSGTINDLARNEE